jgi:hypothetical protein
VADNVFSSPDQKTPRSQRPDHQSGAQLGQFRPTAEQTEQSILKRVTVAVEKRSNHIYISLPMNNQSQVEFHFFSPTARGGRGRRFVRGKPPIRTRPCRWVAGENESTTFAEDESRMFLFFVIVFVFDKPVRIFRSYISIE